jgi:hypothetical protein
LTKPVRIAKTQRMPIDPARLESQIHAFVRDVPTVLARLNHDLLAHELGDADNVWAVKADDAPALLSIADDGALSICRTSPEGVTITHWGKLKGVALEESFEVRIERTRLQTWTLRHPRFPQKGAVTISTDGLSEDEQRELSALLRRVVDGS